MNLNKVFILGNLTRDPEMRQTPNGQSVANFGVATNRMWTDKTGTKQTQVEFHNVVVWGRLAEIANQYLAKGRLVFVEGRLTTRSWQDNSGQTKYKTEIIAEGMQLGPRFGASAPASPKSAAPAAAAPEVLPEVQLEEAAAESGEIKVGNIPF